MRHNTPHYELIASCLTGSPPSPGPGWDWDQTIHVAAREEVLPALLCRLEAPPEVTDFFEGIHELNADRNTQLLSEVQTHACLLNQAGIEPVLLKGAAYLLAGIYPDPSRRWIQDIDLLVHPSQSAQAFELIQSSGYEPFVPNPVGLVLHHHPALMKDGCIPVEVHPKLGHGACSTFLTASEIIRESTPLKLGSAVVRLPSPEHLMTHLVIHSQMHHGGHDRIWPTLRAMHDLVLLASRFNLDWDSIHARFRAHRKEALLNLHLRQVEKALRIPPPFELPRGGLRWWYRQALWSEPRLRYIDPVYSFSRIVLPKISVTRRLLKHPLGRKYILTTPFRAGFYKRFLSDIAEG